MPKFGRPQKWEWTEEKCCLRKHVTAEDQVEIEGTTVPRFISYGQVPPISMTPLQTAETRQVILHSLQLGAVYPPSFAGIKGQDSLHLFTAD